jgi:hypothetical protein
MDILMEDSSNINFRVRIDIIYHLENYITRLSSTIERPKVLKHKKYSSYNYLEDIGKESAPSQEPKEKSETDSMIFNSIEVLLVYMWEVRLKSLISGLVRAGQSLCKFSLGTASTGKCYL